MAGIDQNTLLNPQSIDVNRLLKKGLDQLQSANVVQNTPVGLENNHQPTLVKHSILEGLSQSLKEKGIVVPDEKLEEFTPKNVANQILQSIQQSLTDGLGLNLSKQEEFEQIEDRLKQSVGDVRQQLNPYGSPGGGALKIFDDIQHHLHRGMDQLAEQLGVNPSQSAKSIQSVDQAHVESSSSEMSMVLEIETKDGDMVSVMIDRQSMVESKQMYHQDERGEMLAFSRYESKSSQLEFVVEGELDEDELASIEKLMGNVNQLANEFFKGDLAEAFEKSKNLGFDTEQLASFSANLSMSESSRRMDSYREVSQLEDDSMPHSHENHHDSGLPELVGFMNFLDGTVAELEESGEFNRPDRLVVEALDRMIAMFEQSQEFIQENVEKTQSRHEKQRDFIDSIHDFYEKKHDNSLENSQQEEIA